jgi:hypothetical protein
VPSSTEVDKESAGPNAVTSVKGNSIGSATATLDTKVNVCRKRMRTKNGGYRRDHPRALARRVEVDAKEVRIRGSKSVLLRTLVAASSAKTAGFGGPSSVPKWRAGGDSNLRPRRRARSETESYPPGLALDLRRAARHVGDGFNFSNRSRNFQPVMLSIQAADGATTS